MPTDPSDVKDEHEIMDTVGPKHLMIFTLEKTQARLDRLIQCLSDTGDHR